MDRRARLLERAAAANVCDRLVDIGVGRLRLFVEEGGDGHDHAALAIAALRNVVLDPRFPHLVQDAVLGQPLDGGDLPADSIRDGDAAGTSGDPVDQHRASAALRNASAVLGSRQTNLLPDGPQKRHVRFDVDVVVSPLTLSLDMFRSLWRDLGTTQRRIPSCASIGNFRHF